MLAGDMPAVVWACASGTVADGCGYGTFALRCCCPTSGWSPTAAAAQGCIGDLAFAIGFVMKQVLHGPARWLIREPLGR